MVTFVTLILKGILPRARRTRARNLSQEDGQRPKYASASS